MEEYRNISENNDSIVEDFVDYDNLDSNDDNDENNQNKDVTKKAMSFSCDECQYTSHGKSSLMKHVKTFHNKEEFKLVNRKRETDNLASRKKTEEDKFSCDECQFKTNNKKKNNQTT